MKDSKKYLVCNGYKLQDYVDEIIDAYKSNMNIIDVIDSVSEYEMLKKANLPLNVGLRIHIESQYSLGENDRFGLNDDEFNYNDSIFSNEEDDDEINEGVAEGLISKTNLNCFSCIENNNEFNKMNFLKRKRKMPKHDEDEFLQYDNKEEDEEEKSNERCYLSSNQDNNNIFNKEEKMKNHKICQIQFKEGE